MPKPLTIIRGSLYKRADASCNKSLGSSRKWKKQCEERGKGRKKEKKKISCCTRDIILSQYSKSPPLFSPKGMSEYKTSITTCGIPRTIQNNSLAPLQDTEPDLIWTTSSKEIKEATNLITVTDDDRRLQQKNIVFTLWQNFYSFEIFNCAIQTLWTALQMQKQGKGQIQHQTQSPNFIKLKF